MGEVRVEDDRRFLPRTLYERVDADTLKFVADSAHVIGEGSDVFAGLLRAATELPHSLKRYHHHSLNGGSYSTRGTRR